MFKIFIFLDLIIFNWLWLIIDWFSLFKDFRWLDKIFFLFKLREFNCLRILVKIEWFINVIFLILDNYFYIIV